MPKGNIKGETFDIYIVTYNMLVKIYEKESRGEEIDYPKYIEQLIEEEILNQTNSFKKTEQNINRVQ